MSLGSDAPSVRRMATRSASPAANSRWQTKHTSRPPGRAAIWPRNPAASKPVTNSEREAAPKTSELDLSSMGRWYCRARSRRVSLGLLGRLLLDLVNVGLGLACVGLGAGLGG